MGLSIAPRSWPTKSLFQLLAVLCLSTVIGAQVLSQCLSNAGIQTSFQNVNSTWAADIITWQRRIQPVPAAVTYPTTTDQIAAALVCAKAARLKVTVFCGGHSFLSWGMGGYNNELVVHMRNFQDMNYNETNGYFTVGGGARVGPAGTWLWNNYGAHFPHPRGSFVGMAGTFQGGALGTTSRFLGISMDTLVSIMIMTADGNLHTASDSENRDLFWGFQGAGASFGVVISMTMRTWKPTYPIATKYSISLGSRNSTDDGVKALLALQDYATSSDCPDELYIRWILTGPPWGGSGYYYGPPENFNASIQPFMDALPPNTTLTSSTKDFFAMEVDATGGFNATMDSSRPRSFYTASLALTADNAFTPDTAAALFEGTTLAFNRTDITKAGFIDLWGGVARDVKDCDTSYAHGNNLFLIRWEGDLAGNLTTYPADGAAYIWSGLGPFMELQSKIAPLRGYGNYRNSLLSEEQWATQLYGGNFRRLKDIKARVDPHRLFSSNAQSIPVDGGWFGHWRD